MMHYIIQKINLDYQPVEGHIAAPSGYVLNSWRILDKDSNLVLVCWEREPPKPPSISLPTELMAPLADVLKRWLGKHMG